MTTRTEEPIDGGLVVDPAIARVLLRLREAVATATETAARELRALGVEQLASEEVVRMGLRWTLRRP